MVVISEERKVQLEKEVQIKASRSSGAGGQHVNKVNTRVELRFHVEHSQILSDDEKELVLENLSNRIITSGELILTEQSERSQYMNRKEVLRRFIELLTEAITPVKKRKAVQKPPAIDEKRLEEKKRRSEIKQTRRKDFDS